MPYEYKENQFSLFYFEPKDANGNQREKGPNDPTLTGQGKVQCSSCQAVNLQDFAVYKNLSQDGQKTYFKGTIKPPYKKQGSDNIPI